MPANPIADLDTAITKLEEAQKSLVQASNVQPNDWLITMAHRRINQAIKLLNEVKELTPCPN